jgi:hypothetical protein
MKKLIAAILFAVGLSLQAQESTNRPTFYMWTNAPIATNYIIGTFPIPLSTNGAAGLKWAVKKVNADCGLVGTNRLSWKDLIAYAAWDLCERWGVSAKAEQENREKAQTIRAKLADLTDEQLDAILAITGQ